jgi:holo-[acyl-carrier protein] synthase
MIFGIGTDIVEIDRIRQALARTPRLPQRILTPEEQDAFNRSARPEVFLRLTGAAEALAQQQGIGHWHLSYSDERAQVIAFVIAEIG